MYIFEMHNLPVNLLLWNNVYCKKVHWNISHFFSKRTLHCE